MTNDTLAKKVYEDGRNLGFLAWHITYTVGEMMHSAGLPIENFDKDMHQLKTVEELADNYTIFSKALVSKIETLPVEKLEEEIPIYGEVWKLKDILKALVYHQIHHRGQMTVLMRQAGLKVPGIYGPSKEEWTAYGMPAQE